MLALNRELVSFILVGGTGFLMDAGCLILLFHVLEFGHYSSRLVAFAVAVTVTWILNRTYTFQATKPRNIHTEYVKYFSTQTIGALINLGIYALCLAASPVMRDLPVLALGVGSVIAMVFNYFAMKFYVFPG
jgi:putative flippase GtrA